MAWLNKSCEKTPEHCAVLYTKSSVYENVHLWCSSLSRCAKYSASAQRPATASCGKAKSVVSKSAEPIVFRRLIFSRFSASVAEKQSRRNVWTQFVYKKCSAEVRGFEPGSGINRSTVSGRCLCYKEVRLSLKEESFKLNFEDFVISRQRFCFAKPSTKK